MSGTSGSTRRTFLLSTAAAAALSALKSNALPATNSLTALSATAAVAHMTRGDITAEHYAEALLARCRTQHSLNAFISLDPERVLEDARTRDKQKRAGAKPGLLFGLPIPVKDSVNTQDYPTTGGTPALRHFRPTKDAPTVAALKSAGALVLGKTNLHELSYGWTSNNLAFGAVRNPYDPARIPGGSSGGTAAAVAAHLAPLGVAEDTEGSIRVPAAFCGIAGFRPTTGRYSTRGCIPITPLFDQLGPLARSVTDLALFDSVISGAGSRLRPRALRGVRVGVVRDYFFEGLDPEVERLTDLALAKLRDAGAIIVEGELPELARLIELTTVPIQNHDVGLELARYLQEYAAGVDLKAVIAQASPDIHDLFLSDLLPGGANSVSDATYVAARERHLPALRRLYADYFSQSGVAAVVFPATRVPPPLIGEETTINIRGQEVSFELAVARNIAPGSTAGLPGLVLPVGMTTRGLPVAFEFDAPSGADRALLELGLTLELALGGIPAPKDVV